MPNDSTLVTTGDLEQVKRRYPEIEVEMPSPAQQRVLLLHLRGLSKHAIQRNSPGHAPVNFPHSPLGRALIDLYRSREFEDVRATRQNLTNMLFEAYYKAGSTLEEVAAIKEIGKLNGLYESDKQKGSTTTVNVVGQVNNVKQLERMSENQLLNLAKDLESDLEPEIVERPKLPPAEEIEDAVYEESGSDVPAMLIENTRRNKDAAGAIKRIEESRENEADQIGTQDGVGGDVGDAGSGIAPTGVPDFVAAAGNSNQYPGQSPYYDLDDFGGEVQTGSRPRNTENGTDE